MKCRECEQYKPLTRGGRCRVRQDERNFFPDMSCDTWIVNRDGIKVQAYVAIVKKVSHDAVKPVAMTDDEIWAETNAK